MRSTIIWKILASTLTAGALASSACHAEMAPAPVLAPEAEGPMRVAAASATVVTWPTTAAFPAHEAGVRAAAAKGADELRWYIQRTRMIHNFYYPKYAPEE